ncbi:MAG: hypothetical protein ABSE73_33070, partial [Planctomycetota bacterium]
MKAPAFFLLFSCALALLFLAGCKSKERSAAPPGALLRQDGEPRAEDKRLLLAQIVEDYSPSVFDESAVIEGAPYKWFLRSLVGVDHDDLKEHTNQDITFDKLMANPGLYRGQVVTLRRGVVLEVARAALPPEYGLPPGYTVLPAVFVDSFRDVYALRILCPPKSKLYEKLEKGIEEDAVPVLRMTGYFMKLYARRTGDPHEPPWRKPLLICPEPAFSVMAEPRKVWDDLRAAQADKLLGGQRIDAPGAEERLVVEVLPGGAIRADGRLAGSEPQEFLAVVVAAFRKRLPQDQAEHPAAVVLLGKGAESPRTEELVA